MGAQGVNVLAVMDRGHADLMDGRVTMWTARDVRVMRDAVAELVEAQRTTLRMLEAAHRGMGMWTDDNPRIVRARAALLPFQSEAES